MAAHLLLAYIAAHIVVLSQARRFLALARRKLVCVPAASHSASSYTLIDEACLHVKGVPLSFLTNFVRQALGNHLQGH